MTVQEIITPHALIVGGGLAGCALAVALRKQGLDVVLVERDREPRDRFRGEYLQPFAARFLADLGFDEITQSTSAEKIHELHFTDLGENQQTVLSEILIQYPVNSFALVMPNKEIQILAQRHAASVLKEFFFVGATVEPMNLGEKDFHLRPKFLLNIQNGQNGQNGRTVQIEPRWVIGCDGRQSSVRKWMKGPSAPAIGSPTLGSGAQFIVGCELDVRNRVAGRYEVIRTSEKGTLAVFPLNQEKNRCYWSTDAVPGKSNKREWNNELREIIAQIDPSQNFLAHQPQFIAGAAADTVWFGPSAKGRFLLAGDALAITTPFGGQGMSCAMQHVKEIIRLIDENADRDVHAISRVGREYKASAKKWFRHVNLLNFGLYYLFFGKNPIFKKITHHILRVWERDRNLGARVGRLFAGDDLDTPGLFELLRLWGLFPQQFALPSQNSAQEKSAKILPDAVLRERPQLKLLRRPVKEGNPLLPSSRNLCKI